MKCQHVGTTSVLQLFFLYISVKIEHIYIRNGYPFWEFPAHFYLQIHMPTSSLSSYLAASAKSAVMYIVSANCDFEGETLPIHGVEPPPLTHLADIVNIYGHSGNHGRPGTRRVIMTSPVSAGTLAPCSFCWPNLGQQKG